MTRRPELTTPDGLTGLIGLSPSDMISMEAIPSESNGRTTIHFIEVEWAAPHSASLPGRLVLKEAPLPQGRAREQGPVREIDFFSRLADRISTPPVPRCLSAGQATDESDSHLLVEDLIETHAAADSDGDVDLGPAVDALARVHCAYWEVPESEIAPRPRTEAQIRKRMARMRKHLPALFEDAVDHMPPGGEAIYQRVFDSQCLPWMRLMDPRNQTLAHGDAHLANILHPKESGEAYLIDWEGWQVDLGARDLAYLMLRRAPERRREIERPALERYHRRLLEHGIAGYSFDELWNDYRVCWVRNLWTAAANHVKGLPRWEHMLENAIIGYQDVDGDELL